MMRNLFSPLFLSIYSAFHLIPPTVKVMSHDIDGTCGAETFNPVSEHSHSDEVCEKKVEEACVLNQTSKKGLAAVTGIQNGFLRMLPRKLRM